MSNVLQFQVIILKHVTKNECQFCSVEKRDIQTKQCSKSTLPEGTIVLWIESGANFRGFYWLKIENKTSSEHGAPPVF